VTGQAGKGKQNTAAMAAWYVTAAVTSEASLWQVSSLSEGAEHTWTTWRDDW
jgi:hypothetical protein